MIASVSLGSLNEGKRRFSRRATLQSDLGDGVDLDKTFVHRIHARSPGSPMSQKLDLTQHLFVKNTHLGFDFISRNSNLIPQRGVANRNLLPQRGVAVRNLPTNGRKFPTHLIAGLQKLHFQGANTGIHGGNLRGETGKTFHRYLQYFQSFRGCIVRH